MAGRLTGWRAYSGSLVAAVLVVASAPTGAAAQVDARLERIETQLRALQRAVFPGGDERYFEPEITPETPSPSTTLPGTPSASALTDVLTRLDSIEQQLARLTAATEVNENSLHLLEERVTTIEDNAQPTGVIAVPDSGEPVAGFEGEGEEIPPLTRNSSTPTPGPVPVRNTSTPTPGPVPVRNATPTPGPAPTPAATEPASSGPSAERLAAVQAIAKPATGDQGDDEYVYGFRLWDAKFYPEAQQQLALFVEKYPDHWRTTYGRNLLGRAFLDAGDARRAATQFFENYQADKTAERAPDSLLYLAISMIELGDTNRACIALAEFGDTYPALATGRLQEIYDSSRGRVDCE